MDGTNADSDHSMTWEDFFGSTSDLTPTLIGIYDSLLEPKSLRPEVNILETAKDARNDPPVEESRLEAMKDQIKDNTNNLEVSRYQIKETTRIAEGVKLPLATINKSALYSIRTISDNNGASGDLKNNFTTSGIILHTDTIKRTLREKTEMTTFNTLSPNVKRMISSATETTGPKIQKKTATVGRSSVRHKTNLPLVGATSKISQSGVEIVPSVDIYDQPCKMKTFGKSKSEEIHESPKKDKLNTVKMDFRLNEEQTTYDVPTNNRPLIYDVPNATNKTVFDSLSLPYIDQSIELSINSNDREFDIKLSPKESPPKTSATKVLEIPEESSFQYPKPLNGTNSLHRKDFVNKSDNSTNPLSKTGAYPDAVGSTGNLKCCSIPEKEISRLNPPIVEVTRPLSLSSIASSSSTSSSGVQNKGGVNSAYLASIESLDDNSDADMRSANGSNNFVNNAGMLNKSVSEERHLEIIPRQQAPDEMSGLSQLERVCAEIVQTENVYVEDLRQVVEGYLHEWRRDSTFSEEELSELFNNIEDIYTFNRSLCEELNTCKLDATCIARCFVNNTTGFSVYTSYCTGYPGTMERLAALASKPHSAREFRERQIALGHPLPLASYLLKPVQRILKYHLLLQNVVKQCASSDTEYALLKMTGIAHHIDDMKRRHEHAVRVQEIQSLLYGWNGPDLTTYGELCAEGTFRVFGAKAMRHAFLFDKMLLITKNREDGILAYKSHIMCNNMMLVESIAGAPLSFHVIPWDAPRAQLTLQARSARHKREWTLLLKRVILENYNAVIPSHARQLVMELGQNKTDDDILAEKSHSLITQASMRKQLSAPEYLEKRKLERDRRKSFENGLRGRLKKVNRKYTVPSLRSEANQDCDCAQVSADKGVDYTCENCYIDLCSDCETEFSNKDKLREDKCSCRNEDSIDGTSDKCPECDRSLQYIDAGSVDHLERKSSLDCKCSDFNSSQESFNKEFTGSLNKTRGYHSSDNIIGYTSNKSKEDLSDSNISMSNVRNVTTKSCLKCSKIKENIVATESTSTLHSRKSRCIDSEKQKTDVLRSKSKEDPQRSKLTKIGTWRRKSEPGLQQNPGLIKKTQDGEPERNDFKGTEKIEFECRNCGSNKITRKVRGNDGTIISDPELDIKLRGTGLKHNIEVKMYNTKNIPKKISKLKKSRAKGLRLGSDTTAKFYADFSTDVSTENILHISESNDSLNVSNDTTNDSSNKIPDKISKDDDIDEETYKKLIEKTDSFKKNELEKVKYLNKQKVINETSEIDEKPHEIETRHDDVAESCEESEQPLEQIISQLLLQNREFQKLLKKQQQRNSAQRRHQRMLKSHSNPEPVIAKNNELSKLKPKCGRQTSENNSYNSGEEMLQVALDSQLTVGPVAEDDHIYETLRVENRLDESLHSLNTKSKLIQHNSHISRPKRLPSPPSITQNVTKTNISESDYVYLTFDKLNECKDSDVIYDIPKKNPEKVEGSEANDYYVTMENRGPPKVNNENVYDSLVEVCRRKKEVPDPLPTDYLPMSPDQQNPNTPEIWLCRQKEHFNVCRDRKSGSLPRSFQIVTNNQEDNNLSTFKCKPNSNSKTYLNRDGKVLSIDRPFTIASDQSEISYDDVENYMSEGDILKFNKSITSNDADYAQNISQSTLELEKEIDRCYKNNFEKANLDSNKNENLLTVSQPNLNTSTTSSCEILPAEMNTKKIEDSEIIHPEHKIYKPTSNMLSLKNVLNRFKNRIPNKNTDESEMNTNDQSSPDSMKSDPKSPTSEKRAALNPRNYSKNLLQRFRSIISDEHTDDNQNKPYSGTRSKSVPNTQNNLSEIKVVITSTDVSSSTSTMVYAMNNDDLSKSVCEQSTLTKSQTEKNNLDVLSHSCDNITNQPEICRPTYEKSVSLVTNVSTSVCSSSSKSTRSSYQSLNKLPIYMQGSKHLGARIAQSDYEDPSTLISEKSALKNINVLINKNAIRPDSLFSNSSFVTSSSEGTYNEIQNKIVVNVTSTDNKQKNSDSNKSWDSTTHLQSDESYYEKSFEKIEQVIDEDVFRDSAVYSDQEDEETKADLLDKNNIQSNKIHPRTENVKNCAINTRKSNFTFNSSETRKNVQANVKAITDKEKEVKPVNETAVQNIVKPKIAPPVPIKPKITNIPSVKSSQTRAVVSNKSNNLSKMVEPSTKIVKRNSSIRQSFGNTKECISKSKALNRANSSESVKKAEVKLDDKKENSEEVKVFKPTGNIQIKRLSFERASLDSATRKLKMNETKKPLTESSKSTTKSVLERRMEIESLSKVEHKPSNIKKPTQISRPRSITTKVATFERSISENGKKETLTNTESSIEKSSIALDKTNVSEQHKSEANIEIDSKGSWVKQVVNKFQ